MKLERTRLLAMGLIVTLNLGSGMAWAGEFEHRWMVQRALAAVLWEGRQQPLVFFSDIYVQREIGNFTQSTGRMYLSVSDKVTSNYHSGSVYSLSGFYEAQRWRKRWVLNFLEPQSHWLVSLGHDNGVQTRKLNISPSLFLGLAKAMTLPHGQSLQIALGKWFGAMLNESPCVDDYDRQYWCPNLTAWIDRPKPDASSMHFYEFKYQLVFD
ncbi:MAG: hypothetical protein ACKO69_04010 [Limnohabitans sp.]